MKTKINLLLSTFFFVFCMLIFCSCKKYDEGPAISFRSPENRITKEWRYQKFISDNNDLTDDYSGCIITFSDDNTLIIKYPNDIEYKGEWNFADEKTVVVLSYNYDCTDKFPEYQLKIKLSGKAKYSIIKLKNDECFMKGSDTLYSLVITEFGEFADTLVTDNYMELSEK